MKKTSKAAIYIFAVFALLAVVPLSTMAQGTKTARDIVLGASESVNGDYIHAGNSVDVQGKISGDAMIAGGNVDMSGETNGDVLAAGGYVMISGKVGANVRGVGGNVTLSGQIGRNATFAGGNVRTENNSKIGGNAYIGGGSITLKGSVDGVLQIAGGMVVISGKIGGDVTVYSDSLSVRDGAEIKGKLTYYSNTDAIIDGNAKIVGGVEKKPQPLSTPAPGGGFIFGAVLAFLVWKLLSLLVVALVAWKLFPSHINKALDQIQERFWQKLGWGLVLLVVVPVGSVIGLLTVIGIPLALITLALYGIGTYLAYGLGVLLFGKWLASWLKLPDNNGRFPWYALFSGLVVIGFISLVPFFGGLVRLALLLWGAGALLKLFSKEPQPQQLPV